MYKIDKLIYNYIVIGNGYDYYNYVYGQLKNATNARFVSDFPITKFGRSIFVRHFLYNLPFKWIWCIYYIFYLKVIILKIHLKPSDKLCFLMLAGGANNSLLKLGICEKLRKSFVNSKVVFFINDLVEKTHQPVDLMKKHSDLVYSFDPMDCRKYGLIYHVIPYSDFSFVVNPSPKYDLAFVGAAKDRLDELYQIYNYLESKGINCFFRIIGVPEDKQIKAEGLSYSGRISYEENLQLLQDCNCILDIVQGNSSGNTIRIGEAIFMGKKVLTNNSYTPENGVYDNDSMRYFGRKEDIDLEFILGRKIPSYNKIKDLMYPSNLFSSIEGNFADECCS